MLLQSVGLLRGTEPGAVSERVLLLCALRLCENSLIGGK